VDDDRSQDFHRGSVRATGDVVADAPPFQRRVPAATVNLAELRRTLRAWLEGAVEDVARRGDIVLAASELAAAAMRAVPSDTDAVSVAAWVDDGDVVVESRADVDAEAFVGGPSRAFDGNDGERGFSVVAALADVLAVKGAPRGVIVRARLANRRFGPVGAG
jgi:hypothetical protein